METVRLPAMLGGTDNVTLNDLAGTSVTSVHVNLAGPVGGGDAQPDAVVVNGSEGDDAIVVAGDASGVAVTGLAAACFITGAEPANDALVVHALGGVDTFDASGLAPGVIQLLVDGVP